MSFTVAAQAVGVHPRTVRHWYRTGEIAGGRPGGRGRVLVSLPAVLAYAGVSEADAAAAVGADLFDDGFEADEPAPSDRPASAPAPDPHRPGPSDRLRLPAWYKPGGEERA
ncbi:MAG: hypothetical protein ACRD0F_07620, partial [Acidimicrobiales bacterium]